METWALPVAGKLRIINGSASFAGTISFMLMSLNSGEARALRSSGIKTRACFKGESPCLSRWLQPIRKSAVAGLFAIEEPAQVEAGEVSAFMLVLPAALKKDVNPAFAYRFRATGGQ